jgi:drug/metabolite transporter (DMT)-like permease
VGEFVRTFIVIFLATLSAAVGEVLLSYGMRRNGQIDLTKLSQWVDLILSVVRNPYVFVGVVFLGIFFFLYLAALSWADLSFIMPLTAMSYFFATLMAKFILREEVSWVRWGGTIIIIIGITLISLDYRQRSSDSYVVKYQDSGNGSEPEVQKGNNF